MATQSTPFRNPINNSPPPLPPTPHCITLVYNMRFYVLELVSSPQGVSPNRFSPSQSHIVLSAGLLPFPDPLCVHSKQNFITLASPPFESPSPSPSPRSAHFCIIPQQHSPPLPSIEPTKTNYPIQPPHYHQALHGSLVRAYTTLVRVTPVLFLVSLCSILVSVSCWG